MEAECCAVSILSILFCAHSTDRKGFIKTAPRTVSPRLPLSPWGPWWRERRQGITPSLPKSREKLHKAWQIGWDMRYIQDDRWGRWCQQGPKLPPYPGKSRHVGDWGHIWWSIWWSTAYFSLGVCSLWEFRAPALAEKLHWVTKLSLIFILPLNHEVLLVPVSLLGQCLLGVPGKTQVSFYLWCIRCGRFKG